MRHIAIDLGKMESQVCIRNADGTIVEERKITTSTLDRFFKRQAPSRIVVETCAEAFRVADLALSSHHEVRVVPATLVRSLGVGARRIKTDRRDAQVLSEASCRIDLPSVHIPTDLARHRRSTCQARETLLACRTSLINSVRGWARTQLLKIRTGDMTTFPQRVRHAALNSSNGLPEFVERLLSVIGSLNEQIAAADKELELLAKDDPTCQRLMSVPGVGPVTSLRFISAIDDRTRFPTAHSVQSFFGLTPGENSSSQRQQRTGITKAGPAPVRRTLIQAAWCLRRLCPGDPICQWAMEIEKRRGKLIATVAVARKLAGILFALWRDGSRYEPNRAARRN